MPLDFPSSPTNGQVYGNYYYNSARGAWNALLPAATPNFFTGAQLIDSTATSSLISTTPLTVKGLSGQTANLQEWEDSTGTVLASITAVGNGIFSNYVATNTTGSRSKIRLWNDTTYAIGMITPITFGAINNDYAMTFQMNSVDNRGFWWGDSNHTSAQGAMSLSTNGKLSVAHSLRLGYGESDTTVPGASATADINIDAAAKVGIVVKAAASQTADLQQWQSSTGAVLSEINSAGELQVPRIGLNGQPPNASFFIDATGRAKFRSDGSSSSGIWFTDSAGAESAFLGMGGTASTDALGIWHNSAWRLQVDTLGRVVMPGQPSFMAWRTTSTAVNNTVIYNNVQHNVGGHYNTTNGRFTAPVAGKYHFSINSIGNVTGGTIRLTVRKNGSRTTIGSDFQLRIPVTANYNQGSLNFVWELAANDYIDIYVTEGTEYSDGSAYSNWSGYLIG